MMLRTFGPGIGVLLLIGLVGAYWWQCALMLTAGVVTYMLVLRAIDKGV